jgi:enamine deaminase RidA (YjgF/YER057c/UK114 family)
MSAVDDVDKLIEHYQLATAEFVKGNPEPYKALFSHREDVTLANPFFPPVRGWEQVAETLERTAARLRDGEGNLIGPGDRHAQARQTLENLALALEAVGATGRDVIKATVYVVAGERADLSSVWVAVQESSIAGAASTLLGVSMLALEGQLVEIETIAVLE